MPYTIELNVEVDGVRIDRARKGSLTFGCNIVDDIFEDELLGKMVKRLAKRHGSIMVSHSMKAVTDGS